MMGTLPVCLAFFVGSVARHARWRGLEEEEGGKFRVHHIRRRAGTRCVEIERLCCCTL
ncbi:unnamed protein product [Ectocarpus sp. 12 AP-2014]